VYGGWDGWTACDADCGGGWQTNTRSVERDEQGDGAPCDYSDAGLLRQRQCNTEDCMSDHDKCRTLFGTLKDADEAQTDNCFAYIKTGLENGVELQGAHSDTCLWNSFTPMDVRAACPEAPLTYETVVAEYPQCVFLLLDRCHTSQLDCSQSEDAEVAQGQVWNANKATPYQGCPSPGEFKVAVHDTFKAQIATKVDINVASKTELESLFDITSELADAIIQYRENNGSFSSVDALEDVVGIDADLVTGMFSNAGTVYGKPVITSAQAETGNFCTYGQVINVDWDASSQVSSNVDSSNSRVKLGDDRTGEISGSVDLGQSGPWRLDLTVFSSGSPHRDAQDEALLTLDDRVESLSNDGSVHDVSQDISASEFDFHFSFRSLNDVSGRHMGISDATATCIAEPTNCEMHDWGDWGDCSQECSHEAGDGGGLRYRSRGVKTNARYGGMCTDAREQRQKCNDHPCPWSSALEAEDAFLGGCAMFDNQQYYKTITPRTHFKGSGYVSMDADGDCGAENSTITWKVDVPEHGRYQLQFRYAVDDTKSHSASMQAIANDVVVIDHAVTMGVDFPAVAGSGLDDWLFTSVEVDFFAGENTVVLEAFPHSDDDSKPHIDRVVVTQLEALSRCVPGTTVEIAWADSATSNEFVHAWTDSEGSEGVVLGDATVGTISGYADLGAVGPWSVQFDVDTTAASEPDWVQLLLNHKISANIRKNEEAIRMVNVPTKNAHLEFQLKFNALQQGATNHMKVHNAVAVCQGCSDVKCTRKSLPSFIAGSATDAGYKIEVQHPHGSRAGQGSHGLGEKHGNHHTCSWDEDRDSCQCSCETKQHKVTRYASCSMQDNQYRVTSRYQGTDKEMKYVERCMTCPAGKFVSANNQESCQWQAENVYLTSSAKCVETEETAKPCLDGKLLAGVSADGKPTCCKKTDLDGISVEVPRTCYTPNFWEGYLDSSESSEVTAQCKEGYFLTGLPTATGCHEGTVAQYAGAENIQCCRPHAPASTEQCHWSSTGSCAATSGYVMAGARFSKASCALDAVKCCFALGQTSPPPEAVEAP
jgi:competence ComEA-like helix-hairpin-helix protein